MSNFNIVYDHMDPTLGMSVGNGEMAFNVDVTGLQTFPEVYKKDVPLATMSNWGWHSFPNPDFSKQFFFLLLVFSQIPESRKA